jgi:hypothetical protein
MASGQRAAACRSRPPRRALQRHSPQIGFAAAPRAPGSPPGARGPAACGVGIEGQDVTWHKARLVEAPAAARAVWRARRRRWRRRQQQGACSRAQYKRRGLLGRRARAQKWAGVRCLRRVGTKCAPGRPVQAQKVGGVCALTQGCWRRAASQDAAAGSAHKCGSARARRGQVPRELSARCCFLLLRHSIHRHRHPHPHIHLHPSIRRG